MSRLTFDDKITLGVFLFFIMTFVSIHIHKVGIYEKFETQCIQKGGVPSTLWNYLYQSDKTCIKADTIIEVE